MAKKKQQQPPNYRDFKEHIPKGPMTDECLKTLKEEREAYMAKHPKPWYL